MDIILVDIMTVIFIIAAVMYIYWQDKQLNRALNALNKAREWQDRARTRARNTVTDEYEHE